MNNQSRFIINGLAGRRCLEGVLKVNGAKNAILKILASSILFKDGFKADNVPSISDVSDLIQILKSIGIETTEIGAGKIKINIGPSLSSQIPSAIAQKLRASIVLTGPLLARTGQVNFHYPGGCVIGKRPIDFFLEGFSRMGASVSQRGDDLSITKTGKKLSGTKIFFKNQTVTGTETFMMAGVLAEGQTILKNVSLEPEVISLGNWLKKTGADIKGLGTSTMVINGGHQLSGINKTYQTIPDRIEAGSFLILAALAGSNLTIDKLEPDDLEALIHSLELAGVKLEIGSNYIKVAGHQPKFKSLDIKTHEYPGFPTDLQAPMAVFLTQSDGQSFVFETIFEGRLNYLETLGRMGAEVKILDAHRAFIVGPRTLHGREMESPDLRAGLAYILAAIIASGQSIIHNIHFIDRGYENIENRLASIGVKITRENTKECF